MELRTYSSYIYGRCRLFRATASLQEQTTIMMAICMCATPNLLEPFQTLGLTDHTAFGTLQTALIYINPCPSKRELGKGMCTYLLLAIQLLYSARLSTILMNDQSRGV